MAHTKSPDEICSECEHKETCMVAYTNAAIDCDADMGTKSKPARNTQE